MNFGQTFITGFIKRSITGALAIACDWLPYLGFEREASGQTGSALIIAIIVVGLVFNAAGVKRHFY